MGTEGKYLILGLADAGKRTLLKHLAIGDLETSDDGKVTSITYKGIQLLVSSCHRRAAAAAAELHLLQPAHLDSVWPSGATRNLLTTSVRCSAGLESGWEGLPWRSGLRGGDGRSDRDHVYGGLGRRREPGLCLSQGAEAAFPDARD